jgi:hypothetical protein
LPVIAVLPGRTAHKLLVKISALMRDSKLTQIRARCEAGQRDYL